MFDQLLARLRQVGALAETFHERHLEAPFEFLHLMRHRRLRQVQFLRRRSETAAFNHFDERSELIEIEAAHGYTVVYCFHQNNHLARRSSFAKIGCRGSRQRQQVRLAWPSPLTWTTSTPISKPSGFWGSRSNAPLYPLPLLTSSPPASSPAQSSN